MEKTSLQFQGTQDQHMLIVLIVAIVLILVIWGVVQLLRRRIGYGLLCLAGALGPVAFIPALLVDAAVRYTSGRRQGAQVSMLAAGVLAVATVALASLAAGSPGAMWMGLLGLQIALAVGLFYSAVYAYLGTVRISALMALRCLAILALMLGLFKPVLGLAPDLDANRPRLPILVDRSASMNTTDMSHMPNRYVQAVQMLSSQRERIERYFRPAWLHFGESLQTAASFDALAKLAPAGPGTDGTNIAGSVKRAAGTIRGRTWPACWCCPTASTTPRTFSATPPLRRACPSTRWASGRRRSR